MAASASSSRFVEADRDLAERLRGIRDRTGGAPDGAPDSAKVREVVEEVLGTLKGTLSLGDIHLYHEIEALADEIQVARREFVALRPGEIRSKQIEEAGHELDAVAEATSKATWEILGAMEEMETLAAGLAPELRENLQAMIVRVYEACNFQDITGQRVGKVVRTLKHVEAKMEALLAVFDHLPHFDEEDGGEAPGEASLLNGPALPQSGTNTQADIDALLASFD